MDPNNIGIDLAALRRFIEGSVVRSFLNTAIPDVTVRRTIFTTISVFERHGIDAAEAFQIISELGQALQNNE